VYVICYESILFYYSCIILLLSESRLSAGGGGVVVYRVTLIIEKGKVLSPFLGILLGHCVHKEMA